MLVSGRVCLPEHQMVPKMVSILVSPKSGSHSLASMAVASMPTGPLVPTQVRKIWVLQPLCMWLKREVFPLFWQVKYRVCQCEEAVFVFIIYCQMIFVWPLGLKTWQSQIFRAEMLRMEVESPNKPALVSMPLVTHHCSCAGFKKLEIIRIRIQYQKGQIFGAYTYICNMILLSHEQTFSPQNDIQCGFFPYFSPHFCWHSWLRSEKESGSP